MYVCLCNGHRDTDIREAAKTGLRCAKQVYNHLGKKPQCGRCVAFATKIINEVHATNEAAASMLERVTA